MSESTKEPYDLVQLWLLGYRRPMPGVAASITAKPPDDARNMTNIPSNDDSNRDSSVEEPVSQGAPAVGGAGPSQVQARYLAFAEYIGAKVLGRAWLALWALGPSRTERRRRARRARKARLRNTVTANPEVQDPTKEVAVDATPAPGAVPNMDEDEHWQDEHHEDKHRQDEHQHREDEHRPDEHHEDEHHEDEHRRDEHHEDEHRQDELHRQGEHHRDAHQHHEDEHRQDEHREDEHRQDEHQHHEDEHRQDEHQHHEDEHRRDEHHEDEHHEDEPKTKKEKVGGRLLSIMTPSADASQELRRRAPVSFGFGCDAEALVDGFERGSLLLGDEFGGEVDSLGSSRSTEDGEDRWFPPTPDSFD